MRIVAIDFGLKRSGIAATDPMQIIASSVETVATPELLTFLIDYLAKEAVEVIVVGEPKRLDGSDADILPKIRAFCVALQSAFPTVLIEQYDERFTSRIASQRILEIGFNKKTRRDKGLIDRMSAVVILEDYMRFSGRWAF